MTIAELAARLIDVLEGCKLNAYWDYDGKVWTIGFGHTKGTKSGDSITMDQAVTFMAEDFAPLIALVGDRPLLEAAALASFGYNCKIGSLRRFLKGEIAIAGGRFVAVDAPFGEVSGGVHPPGLAARRRLEAALVMASREILATAFAATHGSILPAPPTP